MSANDAMVEFIWVTEFVSIPRRAARPESKFQELIARDDVNKALRPHRRVRFGNRNQILRFV
jgi:hypothetical protein